MLLSSEMSGFCFSPKTCLLRKDVKKVGETQTSVKYKKSLEVRYAVNILPQSSKKKLPLGCLNQLINLYYINYDNETNHSLLAENKSK